MDDARVAAAAVLLTLVIVVAAGASIVWMYVLPGDEKDFYWPPLPAILVGIAGLMGLAAGLRLRRVNVRTSGSAIS